MTYELNKAPENPSMLSSLRKFIPLLFEQRRLFFTAIAAVLVNSALTLAAPVMIGHIIDTYITAKNYHGVLVDSGLLVVLYIAVIISHYIQIRTMGVVGQNVLFKLRSTIFAKIQELPLAFFDQNKAGDLISRINNDTNTLNQFFAQALPQFLGNLFIIIGAGIFLVTLDFDLGAIALIPAAIFFVITQLISPWVKHRNAANLKALGNMSAEIQESLNNFKVIVAFNRRDYFRKTFQKVNNDNYNRALNAGIANNIFVPVYGFSSNLAQLLVLLFGTHQIFLGSLTTGLLISYLLYVSRFYDPLRQMAQVWSVFQQALASWDRIYAIMSLETDLTILPSDVRLDTGSVISFNDVHFRYAEDKEVLSSVSFDLQSGKTYALIGPTGGGKTTTASLMARLYDPNSGTVFLAGQDIRSYTPEERSKKIGFILQDPFLFSGTVKDNIIYGNPGYKDLTSEHLDQILKEKGLDSFVDRFEKGLDTQVLNGGDSISLGQKQLIAFIRAILREPQLLILDEATANVDTVTERQLDEVLSKLPKSTTLVIIAHRLNTIENADEIFFVNAGDVTRAGSMEQALDMLMHGKRES